MRQDPIDVHGRRLNLRRWGEPDGRPLLFLHSLGSSSTAAFLGLGVQPLVDAGYAVAAPDMPGFGGTPPFEADEYDVPNLADFMWSLADELGWQRLVLAGHSWGGSVAVHMAATSPERVRALVLVDSGHLDYGETPDADLDASLEAMTAEAEAERLRLADRATLVRELEVAGDDPIVDAFLEGMMDDGEGGLIARTLGSSRAAAMYHLMRAVQSSRWSAIAAAGIPALLLLATVPEATRSLNESGAARFQAAIPDADIRWISDGSHSLVTDMREKFGRTVGSWLEEHARP